MRCATHGVEKDWLGCLLCKFGGIDLQILPTEAALQGWKLKWVDPRNVADPYYLLHPDGHVVFTWEYTPSMTEVWEKWTELRDSLPIHLNFH